MKILTDMQLDSISGGASSSDTFGGVASTSIANGFDMGAHASSQTNPRIGVGNFNRLVGGETGLGSLVDFLTGTP